VKPAISIIIPAYIDSVQKAEWLNECTESVFSQTFIDWEIVLVDDSSPISIVTLRDGNEKLRKIRTTRQSGPALARNTGAAISRGEAILALDADDMLAEDYTLEAMYSAWLEDKTKVIYGNLQRVDNGEKGKFFSLPDYTFNGILDLGGIIPVTALHSYDCHIKTGGWKNELEAGLEDVEYWIGAGKAGFCGKKINTITLMYRKHDWSRSYALTHKNGRISEMRNRIMEIHKDVYEGRYPMGCCGSGKASYTGQQNNGQQQQNLKITTLDQLPSDQKVWVEYKGAVSGALSVRSTVQGFHHTYQILGTGHKFEVHKAEEARFRGFGRGQDFAVGVAPPDGYTEIRPGKEEPAPYVAPKPALTEIERYDRIASEELGVGEQQVQAVEVTKQVVVHYDLTPLDLPDGIKEILEAESWTIEKLAEVDPMELIPYKGIGEKRSQEIIGKAKNFLS
jgi:glycosyltransferase involved in cell wall biosynthesis